VELGFRTKPMDFLPISVQIVADAGNPIVNSEYTNTEKITNESVFYPDGTKSKLTSTGSINDAGTVIGATLSLIGEIPINSNWYLTPQVSYRRSLNSVVSSNDWKIDIVRAGIGIMYRFGIKEPLIEIPIVEEVPKDTLTEINEIPILADKPMIKGFSAEPVKLRETIITQTYPLLPYIFFDESSVDLQKEYSQLDDGFSEQSLPKNTLSIYYNTLNILGSRMESAPTSTITLKGFTDGKEEGAGLAYNRAVAVTNYLTKKWSIDPDRIKTTAGNLPPLPTNTQYDEAFEENRRVEIYTDDLELLRPVIHSQFIEYRPLQNNIQFDIAKNSKIQKATIMLKYGDENIMKVIIDDDRSIFQMELDDQILNKINSTGKSIDDLTAFLIVNDQDGIEEIYTTNIDIDLKTNEFEIGRLNLIVFDFDRSDITSINKIMIEDFIKNTISYNSLVEITGSTDRLGEKLYNQTLSEKRAKSVSSYISKISPEAKIIKVQGTGDSDLLYDNDLPEGRFYCRTVLIEVKTPIDK